MARRKRIRSPRRASFRRRSSRKGMNSMLKMGLAAAGYGLVREPINTALKRVPYVGGLGDEVVLIGAALVANRYGKGAVKTLAKAAFVIEVHNLARNFNLGSLGGSSNAGSGSEEI